MPNLIPGFTWTPVDVGNRAHRIKGRGLVGHVAVSTARDLRPGPLATRSADWHAYLPKSGPGIQYIDLDVQCWATRDGNKTMAAFESEGGMGTAAQVNAEPWTDDQCESAAVFLAHLHRTEGVPLQVMPNSRPESRGFGTHRLGIDPWRVLGGELWSSARGKLCPGDAKVRQVPSIVARAAQLANPAQASVPEDFMALDAHYEGLLKELLDNFTTGRTGREAGAAWSRLDATNAGVTALQKMVAGQRAAIDALSQALAGQRDDLTAEELKSAIKEAMASVVTVDVKVTDPSSPPAT